MVSFFLGLCFYLLVDKPVRNLDRLVLFPSKISDSFLVKKSQNPNPSVLKKAQTATQFKKGKSKTLRFDELSLKNITQQSEVTAINEDEASHEEEEDANFSDESEDEHTTTIRRAQNMINNYKQESIYKIRKHVSSFDENDMT